MTHIDPEVLALLALGEDVASTEEADHLAGCVGCASELASLTLTARVGRQTLTNDALAVPDARVWRAVQAELGLEQAAADEAARPVPAADGARITPLRPRPWRRTLVAIAAAAAVIVGGVTAGILLRPQPAAVLASAVLEPLPDWPDARGTAQLVETAEGERVVHVTVDAADAAAGYREVWLLTPDATRLVSLGAVDGGAGEFVVPDAVDLSEYSVVDISEEPLDGDPAHSGDSIVRGALVDES